MKKVLIVLATLLSTVAFAQDNSDPECKANQFNCTFQPEPWKGTVEIKPISNIVETCNRLMQANYTNVLACTTRVSSTHCIIYTKINVSMAIIGHELRHCSEGAWHK